MPEQGTKSEPKVSFKDSLNLPRTDFPIRPNAKVDDPVMIERWQKDDLYEKTFVHNKGQAKFILHDGPPYANGNLHLGHAYNKILKDIVTKSQRMLGKQVPVTPGWDCHGLPIEFKVSQENPGLPPAQLKKKCREYANHWINVQREEFKRLGVLMDWDNPYLTMNYSYEAAIMRAFGVFVAKGYIEYKNKTVPWCASCQTVLASAEIEYQERKDPSIYVRFPLQAATVEQIIPELKGHEVSFLIWTTTPWTLPLNRAVLLRPDTQYVAAKINDQYVIMGKMLVEKLAATMGVTYEVIAEFSSSLFVGHKVHHPFIADLQVPVILDQSVLVEDGTACVHSAPGCGPEDYEVGVRNGLEIFSPLTADGKYSKGIAPQELEGMAVTDGQIWVLKALTANNRLFFKTSIKHPYPHCWRCRNGLMFRATKQWFCDLERGDLRNKVLKAIDGITTLPEKSINRLKATVEGRLEWCLSRQRVWGVPIPAIICTDCEQPQVNQQFADTIAAQVAQHGVEYWDEVSIDDLRSYITNCASCGGHSFKKEQDILDVWFDSGVSHYAVLMQRSELAFPADMYLEGKDQHRGWFQSSLLTSMVLHEEACMKIIATHGFTVDDKGRKMSKSLGNVIAPQELIDKLGTDGVRLWAASIDLQSEAVVSDILLQNVQEVFRKIRNTCRFLLSNMYDYNHAKDAVGLKDLMAIDQYALEQLFRLNHAVLQDYANFEFTAVFHKLADYCTTDLSSFYLDIVKDRLYTEKADGYERRSAQTVCWYILDTMTKLMAPILSFTAEQIADQYQEKGHASIHLQSFNALPDVWKMLGDYYGQMRHSFLPIDYLVNVEPLIKVDAELFVTERDEQWQTVKQVRSALLKAIEVKREQGLIKHSLEARLVVHFDMQQQKLKPLQDFLNHLVTAGQSAENFFKELLIVSQVEIVADAAALGKSELAGVSVTVEHAHGEKCPRCWQWSETHHEYKLCKRCQEIVG